MGQGGIRPGNHDEIERRPLGPLFPDEKFQLQRDLPFGPARPDKGEDMLEAIFRECLRLTDAGELLRGFAETQRPHPALQLSPPLPVDPGYVPFEGVEFPEGQAAFHKDAPDPGLGKQGREGFGHPGDHAAFGPVHPHFRRLDVAEIGEKPGALPADDQPARAGREARQIAAVVWGENQRRVPLIGQQGRETPGFIHDAHPLRLYPSAARAAPLLPAHSSSSRSR